MQLNDFTRKHIISYFTNWLASGVSPSGVSSDCFAYVQDGSGAFQAQPLKRLMCSNQAYFICQLGRVDLSTHSYLYKYQEDDNLLVTTYYFLS